MDVAALARLEAVLVNGSYLTRHRLAALLEGADFSVERIEERYPSPVGEVRYDVRWLDDRSTYELQFVSIDGMVRELTFRGRRLPPIWGIGLIALPRLVAASLQFARWRPQRGASASLSHP
jgi:hypothetical protein